MKNSVSKLPLARRGLSSRGVEEGIKVYSVSELNREIRYLLESEYANLWLEGEISNFKLHSSGHMYLTLKDSNAQISAVFFSGLNRRLKFKIKDGLQVLAMGKVSLYEPRGQYQLTIERMEPKGMGALQLAFLQLKEKLEKEGLFSPEHKKEIPPFPRTVGVVTSPTGAAIRDILNVVQRRFHGTKVLLNPVRVQGDTASAEIAQAIGEMNRFGGIDVLIVGRGGGSLEDLWAFNEEEVARAVFASKIPVISAVGHEMDWTICDLVSDLRAPTPSAAAELVVQNREEIEIRIQDFQTRMKHAANGILRNWKERLEGFEASYAFKQPLVLIQQYSQRLDELLRQLQNYLKSEITQKRKGFETSAARLHALSPLAILDRGYSLTFRDSGVLLKDAGTVRSGQLIKTRLHRGTIHSKVTKIEGAGRSEV